MAKWNVTLLLIGLLASTNGLLAQEEIIGYVVDTEGKPLLFATVAFYENGVLEAGTETDQYGEFVVQDATFDEVEFRYLGYQPLRMTRQELEEDNWVVMANNAILLNEIVVVALDPWDRRKCGGHMGHPLEVDNTINLSVSTQRQQLTYYPNPTKDRVRINFPADSKGAVEVLTANRAVLQHVSVSAPVTEIDLSSYPAGTYYLRHLHAPLMQPLGAVVKVE
ncbi:MAG: carboxypeptidase-like regulatory domain-containing protein [Bacteroidota bacterium]